MGTVGRVYVRRLRRLNACLKFEYIRLGLCDFHLCRYLLDCYGILEETARSLCFARNIYRYKYHRNIPMAILNSKRILCPMERLFFISPNIDRTQSISMTPILAEPYNNI